MSQTTQKMSTYNYVVSASRETAIHHSVSGSFTAEDACDVICDKGTRVEIRTLRDNERLEVVATVPVFGRVAALKLIRPMQDAQQKDWLFVLTNRMHFFVLAFESGKVVDRAHGDLSEVVVKTVPSPLVAVDAKSRFVVVHLFSGLLTVIPFDSRTGAVKDTTIVSLEELTVLDMVFSSASGKPLLCVLHEDNRNARHVKTYEITTKNLRELNPGLWNQPNVDPSATALLAVPDGVLVFGSTSVVHLRETAQDPTLQRSTSTGSTSGATTTTSQTSSHPLTTTLPILFGKIEAAGVVDKDGSRILIADEYGGLHLLSLAYQTSQATPTMQTELLGETSIATGVCYLDAGIVFIGSHFGDSQLIRLLHERDEATQSYVELLDTFTNLGPICSMCVVDLDKQGRGQLVTCSGANKDGSLRVVRNGVGVDEQCTVELAGIKGMWTLKQSRDSRYDSFLVQSFSTETRVLGFTKDDNAMETEHPADEEEEGEQLSDLTVGSAFETEGQTLFCGNVEQDWICQVTNNRVRFMKCSVIASGEAGADVRDWTTPDVSSRVTVAASTVEGTKFRLAVGLTGGKLILISDLGKTVQTYQMDHEISCVAVSDKFVAVGLWTDLSVRIIHIESGKEVHREKSFGEEALPRSLVLTRFGGQTKRLHLLVGLGDGRLMFFRLDDDTGVVQTNWKRTVALGIQPIELAVFDDPTTSSKHVFVACDRPAIVYAAPGEKLLLSNVNVANEVTRATPFDTKAFPACLALASEERLVIGTVNDVQKLHIRTIPLGEQPRRIAHQPASNTFGLCTIKLEDGPADDSAPAGDNGGYGPGLDSPEFPESCYVRLLDDRTFEVIDSHRLDEMEHALCIVSMSFAPDSENVTGGERGNVTDIQDDGNRMETNEAAANMKSYFVVGTAFALEDETEPSKGRILVFEVIKLEGEERRLVLVTEKTTKGAVYDLCPFGGKLLAGINAKVQLYRWHDRSTGLASSQQSATTSTGGAAAITSTTQQQTPRGGGTTTTSSSGGAVGGSVDLLSQECGYHGHTLSLFVRAYGNYIVVGDLAKSVSLLYWDPETNSIMDRARDYNATWVAALAVLDDTTFLSADMSMNMIMLRPDKNASAEENGRLVVAGDFHWGDFINVFCKGSLVMRQKQDEEDNGDSAGGNHSLVVRAIPRLLYGTAGGAIGVLATLTEKEFALLDRLQVAMNSVLAGIGGQKHTDWRAFRSNSKTHPSKGFIDGDLVEMLLEMNHSDVEKVAELMNRGLADKASGTNTVVTDEPPLVNVSSLISLVEELTRLH